MKNISFIIFLLLLIFSCTDSSVTNPELELQFKKIAYDSISDSEKETIINDLEDAVIEYGQYGSGKCENVFIANDNQEMCFFSSLERSELERKEKLVSVRFNTINDALLGPIIIILDYNTKEAIGVVGRL